MFTVMLFGMHLVYAVSNPFEKLLMPGPLIKGHKKYEEQCEKCHSDFDKTRQTILCRDCHDKIDKDIKNKEGFHGKSNQVRNAQCKDCHTDHKGRNEDVILLDELSFDHNLTDYRLKGFHREIGCNRCHESGKKHRKTPHDCYSCHKKDDIHKGDLGKKCQDCHNEKSWHKQKEFDHDKTDFPLKDRHLKVSCNSCHPNERYKKTPKDCFTCHRINDVHRGRYGKKCKDCHAEKDWDRVTFDHDRDTKYLLKGKHGKVKCDACHKGNLYEEDLASDCYSCHKKDDEHKGKNGKKCEDCHSENDWDDSSFNHNRDTKYPLRGKHIQVNCTACHRGNVYEKTPRDCYSCHKNSDEHKGRYRKKCHKCHTEINWNRIKFDHTKDTRYPLKGKHKTVVCDACHKQDIYDKNIGKDCFSCHKGQDIHEGNQGEQCQRCHTEQGWKSNVKFDHDLTRFPLIGLHIVAPCEACHLSENYKDTKRFCNGCHREDDIHKGKLGKDCETCHNPNGWDLWHFDHDKTDYPLDGKHKGLDCLACHQEVVKDKIELSDSCYSCHRKDDVHRGNFGRRCEKCHTTRSFEEVEIIR